MLRCFGDESSDARAERVFAVAGVVGLDSHWENLRQQWLDRTAGVPFHAKDCDSDRGIYADRPHQENKALYKDLSLLLAQSGLGGWGFAIDLLAQRQIFPDAPDIAYYKCLTEVLQAMRNFAAYNHQSISFTFDLRRESQYNSSELYRMYSALPEWQGVVFPVISFTDSREVPELQAADLFARETMKALDNRIGPVERPMRKSWKALFDTGRFHIDAISLDWFKSLKVQMPELETQTGMSSEKYLQWLRERNAQHSVTNMFHFMEWTARNH